MIETTNTVTNAMDYLCLRTKATATLAESDSPIQIVGLVPCLTDPDDCRTWTDDCCYFIKVFADDTEEVLQNDVSSFLFEFLSEGDTVVFKLQKLTDGSWVDSATLDDNTYGTFWDIGDITNSTATLLYAGYKIEWANVLSVKGAGNYRFKVESTMLGNSDVIYSEPFCLREWSCRDADDTVRFETYMNGFIGSHLIEEKTFELSDMNWYDSIRMKGFFGYEKPEYEQDYIKYTNNELKQVRDTVVRKYEFTSGRVPNWLHQRFQRYGLMADEILVSDYNYNNASWNFKQKAVILDENYESTFNINSRLIRMKVDFKDRFEQGIKSICND